MSKHSGPSWRPVSSHGRHNVLAGVREAVAAKKTSTAFVELPYPLLLASGALEHLAEVGLTAADGVSLSIAMYHRPFGEGETNRDIQSCQNVTTAPTGQNDGPTRHGTWILQSKRNQTTIVKILLEEHLQ